MKHSSTRILWIAAFCGGSLAGGWTVAAEGVPLRIEVVDTAGSLLPCRLYVQGSEGGWHFPVSTSPDGTAIYYKKQPSERSVEMHTTISAHPCAVDLPPGEYTVTAERGPEWIPTTKTLRVADQPATLRLELKRWIDMPARGWYGGDTHLHRSLEELPNLILAEDLNVAFPMTHWTLKAGEPPPDSDKSVQTEIEPRPITVDPTHIIYPLNTEYELFSVAGRSHTLGAFLVLNQRQPLRVGAPPVKPIAEQAHAAGGLIEIEKHNWPWTLMLPPVMQPDLFELTNNHVWRTEFRVNQFGEVPPDYMHIERTEQGFTERGWVDFGFQTYYALLNCGFKLRPTGATGSGYHPCPVGFGRVYVETGDAFSYDAWLAWLNAGRSFVTTGPMLFVRVNDQPPGSTIKLPASEAATLTIRGEVETLRPLSRVETIVNGEVQDTFEPLLADGASGPFRQRIAADIKVESSGWVVVRAFESLPDGRERYAHSSPIHIEMPGRPLRPRKAEVEYLLLRMRAELERNEKVLPPDAVEEYRQALRVYEKIAETAR